MATSPWLMTTRPLAQVHFDNSRGKYNPVHFVSGGRKFQREVVVNHRGSFDPLARGPGGVGAFTVDSTVYSVAEARQLICSGSRPPLHLPEHEVLREMPPRELQRLRKFGAKSAMVEKQRQERGLRIVCVDSLVRYQANCNSEVIWVHPVLHLFLHHKTRAARENYYEINPNMTERAFLLPGDLVLYRLPLPPKKVKP